MPVTAPILGEAQINFVGSQMPGDWHRFDSNLLIEFRRVVLDLLAVSLHKRIRDRLYS